MLRVLVNFEEGAAREGIAALIKLSANRAGLNNAMAQSVEAKTQDHLTALNSRSPASSFYARAADSSEVKAREDGATVIFTHRGLALRYYGGHVVPLAPRKNLALPTDNVPTTREGRVAPRDAGILAWIPNRKGGPTTGYLVEGIRRLLKSGKNKGKEGIVKKEGGKLMYVLRSWTDHKPDPSVLPTIADFIKAAQDGALQHLETTLLP
jgi:hypothetical protein